MKKLFLSACILISCVAHAAIDAQHSFEGPKVPDFLSVNGEGSLCLSGDRFKDGASSLKFSWKGAAEIVFSNYEDIKASMEVNGAGLMMWVYCTEPLNGPVEFMFLDWEMNEVCSFDFNTGFTGWRAIWLKYNDMKTPSGAWYGELKKADRKTDVAGMIIRMPESAGDGTIYIDRLSFTKSKLYDQLTPDRQLPFSNHSIDRMWQWCSLWKWEQYPSLQVSAISSAQKDMLRTVETRLDEWAATGNPGKIYTAGTLLGRIDAHIGKYGISRRADGTMSGAPLLYDDEFNNSKGEMRLRFIQEIVYWSSLDYLYTGSTAYLQKVIDAMDHAIEQGFAYGSGLGTNHHFGYQIRELFKGVWILRKPLQDAGKLDGYVKVLTYWSGLQEVRMPYDQTRDGVFDAWNTLHMARTICAMLQPTDEERFACMKALGEWTSGSLRYTDGTLGGIKTDGLSYHHGGFYPSYAVGGFSGLRDWCFLTEGTDFVPSLPARKVLKHALMTLKDCCNTLDWGFANCGRHPFNSTMPPKVVDAFARLALLGSCDGSDSRIDRELAGAYMALGGDDDQLLSSFRKAGIKKSSPSAGFRAYNYGAFGIHRRDDWMLTLKGYNSDVWGSEIYTSQNRFGRYLSYGSVQLIGAKGAVESGYVQEGWDWNRFPGTTTIHLPFELLENPRKGTLMERNDSRFPGVSSLEESNGCLAFTYVEKDRPNFCAGATATKSVFCFDNRIVFIGTGISNNSPYPTETTIYQLKLKDRSDEVDINNIYAEAFPFVHHQNEDGKVKLTDTNGNIYIFRNGRGLVVEKKSQSSPSDTKKKTSAGDFVTAYIDHGVSPVNASYEYMMLVRPDVKTEKQAWKKLPYNVLQADDNAHVVMDEITGITAYISYKGYAASETLVGKADAETIVMERKRHDGSIVMSICTPDLGITRKGYITSQPSQPLKRRVMLHGRWITEDKRSDVNIESDGDDTVITVECVDGMPVEFILTNSIQ